MHKLLFGMMVGLLLLNGNAQAAPGPGSEPEKTLHWVGDEDTANAVIKPLVAEFNRLYRATIEVDVKTSTKGIRAVLMGQADLGGTGRYVIEGLPEEMGVNLHPIAWDAVLAVVHPDNPVGNVSLQDLRRILTGEIHNWRQLGGADAPIRLYLHDDPLAGVDNALLELLFGQFDVDTEHAQLLGDGGSTLEAASKDPQGMAFVGMQSVKDTPVKALAIDGVVADYTSLKRGNYPLFRPLYLVVPPSHQNLKLIREFVRFAESAAARPYIRQAGAVPYREAVNLVVRGMRMQRAIPR